MRGVGSWWQSDLTRLGADESSLPLGGPGSSQTNTESAGLLELQGALLHGPQTPLLEMEGVAGWVGFGFGFGFVILLVERVLPFAVVF